MQNGNIWPNTATIADLRWSNMTEVSAPTTAKHAAYTDRMQDLCGATLEQSPSVQPLLRYSLTFHRKVHLIVRSTCITGQWLTMAI